MSLYLFVLFFFNDTATTEIYTLSLHDALPILIERRKEGVWLLIQQEREDALYIDSGARVPRSEEHTSELQSHSDLVCRLLLEKKKKKKYNFRQIYKLTDDKQKE